MTREYHGILECAVVANKSLLTRSFSTYPLRYMQSGSSLNDSVDIYSINYGGGLVAGDHLKTKITVKKGAKLRLLNLSSTKVYKKSDSAAESSQSFLINVEDDAFLFIEPLPVTCFKESRYSQKQIINLKSSSNLYFVDWFTSGRISRGENWDADELFSLNDISIDGKFILRDRWSLGSKKSLYSFTNICTVIIIGPSFSTICNEILVGNIKSSLMWSASAIQTPLENLTVGCIIKIASTTTQEIQDFLEMLRNKI